MYTPINKYFKLSAILVTLLFCTNLVMADGGMYPISMIEKAPLDKAGMKISRREIYNPEGQCLLQAIVQVGGCTGSFVSPKGLIITNHHCAFSSLSPYSTTENNLLEKGYLAGDQKKELAFKGLTCRIMQSHKDVSGAVMQGTEEITDAIAKRTKIANNIESIRQAEQTRFKDLSIEISEMLPGKSYILFRYMTIRDIRIVYVPARNIGEFGGESDNWVWPRHNGDFSFLRAYVNKKGEGTAFDSSNVPYEPKEYLNINSGGVKEGDFVMVLGYPGKTYRHQPAEFMKFHEDYMLPYISDLYEWQINTLHKIGATDPVWMLRQEGKVKSLANTMKNYKGKLKTVGRLELYKQKKREEETLLARLNAKPETQKELKKILNEFESLYAKVEKDYVKYLWYGQITRENGTLRIATLIDNYNTQYAFKKNDPEKLKVLQSQTITQLREMYKGIYKAYDTTYLKKMLSDALKFKEGNSVTAFTDIYHPKGKENFDNWFAGQYKRSKIFDSNYVFTKLIKKPAGINKLNDPFVSMAHGIAKDYKKCDSAQSNYRAQLDNLIPKYVDIKMEATDQLFIPDANSTLRLTYGYIKGYCPADGVYYSPQTYVTGISEKDGKSEDYKANKELIDAMQRGLGIKFRDKSTGGQPVAMLYNTDTSGGNSGSPILNDQGQLIGVNFDRSYEATVNDYAWDESYSRSIGVDIRYVLFITSEVAGAKHLIKEMFVEQQ